MSKEDDHDNPGIIRRHPVYRKAAEKVESFRDNPEKLTSLVGRVAELTRSGMPERYGLIRGRVSALCRMVKAYARREYTEVPWGAIALITTSLVYLVTPMDLVPDFLPIVGFGDDIALLAWTISQIEGDIDRFVEWENRARGEEPDGSRGEE